MNEILKVIDLKVDQLLKNGYSKNNNNHCLKLTKSEYESLKKNLIATDLLKSSEVISYRKLPIKIIQKSKKRSDKNE